MVQVLLESERNNKMTPETNDFETFSYNPFMANEILSSEFGSDVNLYQNISSLDTDKRSFDKQSVDSQS